MQRRALIIGINDYDNCSHLRCAVNDALRIEELLSRHDDGSRNYSVKMITSGTGRPKITRGLVRQSLRDLFEDFDGDVLFFFSGHGAMTPWGGSLVTQEATSDDIGVPMDDVLLLANRSRARDVVIILDCCHSGDLGNPPILQALTQPLSFLREGLTVLAASRPNELAYEVSGSGLFSDALAEGLAGGAADHMGNVSAASLFLYAERLFDAWDQRPVYKSYTARVPTLRTCKPAVDYDVLRSLTAHFSSADAEIELDPEYEAEESAAEEEPTRARKRKDGRTFKKLRDARLLESVEGDDLYWTAMNSKKIRLTHLGKYYWRLIDRGKI
jgi:uncharacterized caspase-like protein